MCHADGSAGQFDKAYAEIIARVASESLSVPAALRASVISGLEQKRALNKRFEDAQRHAADLNFQTFAAGERCRRGL